MQRTIELTPERQYAQHVIDRAVLSHANIIRDANGVGMDEQRHTLKARTDQLIDAYTQYLMEPELRDMPRREPDGGFVGDIANWRTQTPFERYEALHGWRSKRLVDNLNHFLAMIPAVERPEDGPRLDIGTGSCAFITIANQWLHPGHSNRWQGVDIPEGKNPITNGTDRDRDYCPDFTEFTAGSPMPVVDNSIKLATLHQVLHHVKTEHIEDTLKDVYRCLAPGGKLYILEDYIGDRQENPTLKNFVKTADAFFYPNLPGNQKCMREWHNMLTKAGFKPVRHGSTDNFNTSAIKVREAILYYEKPKR